MAILFEQASVIEARLYEVLGDKIVKEKFLVRFSDAQYYLPTLEEFNLFLQNNRVVLHSRDPLRGTEGFDCDDFAYALKGNVTLHNRNKAGRPHSWAMGIIWGWFSWINQHHACNWVMLRDRGMYLVEPQNNRLYTFNHCTGKVQLILL